MHVHVVLGKSHGMTAAYTGNIPRWKCMHVHSALISVLGVVCFLSRVRALADCVHSIAFGRGGLCLLPFYLHCVCVMLLFFTASDRKLLVFELVPSESVLVSACMYPPPNALVSVHCVCAIPVFTALICLYLSCLSP
eukprot:GDKI01021106.1.p1 GENE.GDKI01021106.1~~GDKI01021106.1.p1  ORF type:complete len:137 (+),score=2.58 GDKI01021106.1:50-460(+)